MNTKTLQNGSARSRWHRAFGTIALAALLLAGPASGAVADLTELSLQELMDVTVYGASKFEQRESDAPSAVTVITADEISRYGYRTLADILRSMRGLYVTYDRNYSSLGVRGFNRVGDTNSRVLLLLDGHRLTENIFDSSYLGTDFILDVDLIDRVEVIRGPGSSLYGSNAFFAVVNVITRQGKHMRGTQLAAGGGSLHTNTGRVTYGNALENGLDVLLSGSLLESKGQPRLYYSEFDDPATNHGIAENSDRERNHSIFSRLHFRDLTLEGAFVSRKKAVPTASYDSIFNDPNERTTDALGTIDLKYERMISTDLSIMARANYNRYRYYATYPIMVTDATGTLRAVNRDDTVGEWLGAEVLVVKDLWSAHKVSAGVEYRDNIRQYAKNFNEDPYLVESEIDRTSSTYGFYLQDEVPITPALVLNAGGRYDHYEGFGGTTNPRLALRYRPFADATFKLIHGSAFRAPNIWETFYADNVTKPNPQLRPERVTTDELVFEQRIGVTMRFIADAYYNRISDLIQQELDDTDQLLVSVNKGRARAYGIELELEGRTSSGTMWRGSYARQRTKDESGQELDNLPQHLAKLNLSLPFWHERIFGSVEMQYASQARTLSGKRADAYVLTNLTLFSGNLMKGLDVSASIYNLFDERYGYPGSTQHVQDIIEQDGRTYRVKLVYGF